MVADVSNEISAWNINLKLSNKVNRSLRSSVVALVIHFFAAFGYGCYEFSSMCNSALLN